MSLMISLIGQDLADNTVTLPSLAPSVFANVRFGSDCYSGIRFDSDGNIYRLQKEGGFSSVGTWLQKGAAGSYYIQYTIVSGALDVDAGDGLVMSTDRDYYLIDTTTTGGAVVAEIEFEISTDAPGTTVKAGPQTYNFSATKETAE